MPSLRLVTTTRHVACKSSSLCRFQSSNTPSQQRGFASYRDGKIPYEKQGDTSDRKYGHFDVGGKVYVVTGGGQGLGFSIAEGLVEAGGIVHVLDRSPEPSKGFEEARRRAKDEFDSVLEYHEADVSDEITLGRIIPEIAARKKRLDGLVAGS